MYWIGGRLIAPGRWRRRWRARLGGRWRGHGSVTRERYGRRGQSAGPVDPGWPAQAATIGRCPIDPVPACLTDPIPGRIPAVRFGWHPEPELIGFDDEARSRPALEALGAAAWTAGLDYLYGEAFRRAMGEPAGYAALRRGLLRRRRRPDRPVAPAGPTPSADLLEEFRTRLAPHNLNAYHPRTLSYFTPPPLVMSIVGELLGPGPEPGRGRVACRTIRRVRRRGGRTLAVRPRRTTDRTALPSSLRAGSWPTSWASPSPGTSTCARLLGLARPPRGRELEGLRAYASDQAHFSIARALDELGFPADTLRIVAADERFRLRGGAVAAADRQDRARGLRRSPSAPSRDRRTRARSTGSTSWPTWPGPEQLWLHVDAAYGGAVRLSQRDAGRVAALERADSVTIDPHKWFFQAYDIGALVMRNGARPAGHLPAQPGVLPGGRFGGRRPAS